MIGFRTQLHDKRNGDLISENFLVLYGTSVGTFQTSGADILSFSRSRYRHMLITFPLFIDLWGRGYSDTPLNLPHNKGLFITQIVLAVNSSKLSWTGSDSGGFSMIGYSFGGGVAMSFAAHFPYLVRSIVLLAPGGIIRSLPDGYKNVFFRHPSLIPSRYLKRLVGKALVLNLNSLPHMSHNQTDETMSREEDSHMPGNRISDISDVVQWQYDHHQGFIHSFINTIQHGPLMHQHSDWRRVCENFSGKKILVVLGDSDDIVTKQEMSEDLSRICDNPELVEVQSVAGTHGDLPKSHEVVKLISDLWGLKMVM